MTLANMNLSPVLQVINGINSPLGQWYDVDGDQMIGLEEVIHPLQQVGVSP